jgi:hypothetical protein
MQKNMILEIVKVRSTEIRRILDAKEAVERGRD